MKWLLAVLCCGLIFVPTPAAASTDTPVSPASDTAASIALTTIQYGYPNPVEPGAVVTWHLQGLNEGTEALIDVGVSGTNPDICGDPHIFPGPYAQGEKTPEFTCTETAPQECDATLTLSAEWGATVGSTGTRLTPTVLTTVHTTPCPSTAPSTPPVTSTPPHTTHSSQPSTHSSRPTPHSSTATVSHTATSSPSGSTATARPTGTGPHPSVSLSVSSGHTWTYSVSGSSVVGPPHQGTPDHSRTTVISGHTVVIPQPHSSASTVPAAQIKDLSLTGYDYLRMLAVAVLMIVAGAALLWRVYQKGAHS